MTEYEKDGDVAVFVYYYDTEGKKQFLDREHYIVDYYDKNVYLKNDGNIIATPNAISEFYVTVRESILKIFKS